MSIRKLSAITYLPFEEARRIVHEQGLASVKEFRSWANTCDRPESVPKYPNKIYATQWQGWADWLGTAPREFQQAREFARSLGLRTRTEWESYAAKGLLPRDIPVWPQNAYPKKGWGNWADWLGRTEDSRFRPFTEAREFARSLRLKSRREWDAFSQSGQRPADIPAAPGEAYAENGWAGFGDWLGHHTTWNRQAILAFLDSLCPVIRDLTPAEVFAILSRNGLLGRSFSTNGNADVLRSLELLCNAADATGFIEQLTTRLEGTADTALETDDEPETATNQDDLAVVSSSVLSTPTNLPRLTSLDMLKSLDHLAAERTVDEEILDFLVNNRVAALWQATLDGDSEITIERLRAEEGGTYFHTIRERFLAQYEGARTLPIPEGYSFATDGKIQEPNMMQRLAAFRLKTEKRLGNWSGIGSGKTLAATLGSRVIGARLTVIVAANATLERWKEEILRAFPNSCVIVKERDIPAIDPTTPTYIVLNYEAFQQSWSETLVTQLVASHVIDFIVLDEVQSVRQRFPASDSRRRRLVESLLNGAAQKNPELRVLGMSATPVINTLHEAKTLLELVTGENLAELHIKPTIRNAVKMHQKLIHHGIRYRPQYKIDIDTKQIEIDGRPIFDQIRAVPRRSVLQSEQVLLKAKLPEVSRWLQPGTLVFTQFVTGMTEPISGAVAGVGLKAGIFTGDEKSGLDKFLSREVDVLIGSSPISTGVDGLQRVCNRVILVCLPWTAAEYEQVIGRLHRQGSVFRKVEVIIPLVTLRHDDAEWSWDRLRLQRIEWKRTLADAAVDGVIPEGQLPSKEQMHEQSLAALEEWSAALRQA